MKKMGVAKEFKEIVADIFRVDINKIKNSTNFIDDLNAKSLDIAALIAATENTFGFKTTSEETRKNKTVGQAIAYIKKKTKKK